MDIKQEACKIALKKMFSGSYFDMSTINNLLKMTNTIPDKEIHATLQTVHCCGWDEMTPEFRKWVFETVLTMFSGNGFDLNAIEFRNMNINNSLKLMN